MIAGKNSEHIDNSLVVSFNDNIKDEFKDLLGSGKSLILTHNILKYDSGNMAGRYIESGLSKDSFGSIQINVDFFKGEDGLLIHADNYCLSDFIEFIQAHQCRPIECEITMMTFCTDNPSLCGIVEIDKNGVVVGFHEKVSNPPSNLANGAIYILSNKFMEILNRDYAGVNDFSTEVLSHFIGKIYTYKTDRTFIDIGSPKNLSKARI